MRYVIFGTGGFAKEVVGYIGDQTDIMAAVSTQGWKDSQFDHIPVLEKIGKDQFPDAAFLMCVADPALKRKFYGENPDQWETYVDPRACISPFAVIGRGTIICPNVIVTSNTKVGQFVTLNIYSSVAHDCIVGDFSTFSPYASLMGHCTVGRDAFFGCHATCTPKVSLPDGTKVSAGAVVRKSIEQAATLYGDPAKPRGV